MWPYLDKFAGNMWRYKKHGRTCIRRPKVSLALFFNYNTLMGPAYRVLVDTNFIDFCIPNKLDLEKGMMDCLYAKCEFRITGFFNLM
ncbi:rRNA-processing protein FCF1-like isoform X2 [Quercus lobata]|uniref:rRNA-processing protein FCF1-like isoform X2 n=1 Tax=Quercus lobata TaxID=97700 RepID=UPI00124515C8|nr:rRNA-processing protein FCF1-like isoform X2 [Quercus lobata]